MARRSSSGDRHGTRAGRRRPVIAAPGGCVYGVSPRFAPRRKLHPSGGEPKETRRDGPELTDTPEVRARRAGRIASSLVLAGLLAACGAYGTVKGLLLGEGGSGPNRHLTGFIGGVAADDPDAALVGRSILRRGGDAADAATAVGLALAVTLPSRASLGGGGTCLAYTPGDGGHALAVSFPPAAPETRAPGADRPAAVPMLVRGLYALQDRLGSVRFDELVQPATELARRGFPVSALLADDLAIVQGPLAADPAARAIFAAVDGTALAANDTLIERDLAHVLEQVGQLGPGALADGALARDFAAGATAAGGGLTEADLAVPRAELLAPITVRDHGLDIAFTPLPNAGGVAAARAFELLQADGHADAEAEQLASSVAAYANATGADQATLLRITPPPATPPVRPASTSFAVLDRHGAAVACALTMDNLFGTGRVVPGTGIVLAASPAGHAPALLPEAIAYDRTEAAFRAVVAASGQNDAAAAVAEAMANALGTGKPIARPVTTEGRVNVIACPDLLPGDSRTCGGATDSRGTGLALGNL